MRVHVSVVGASWSVAVEVGCVQLHPMVRVRTPQTALVASRILVLLRSGFMHLASEESDVRVLEYGIVCIDQPI